MKDQRNDQININHWLKKPEFAKNQAHDIIKPKLPLFTASPNISEESSSFMPQKFLLSGWTGNSLRCPQYIKLEKHFHQLVADIEQQFISKIIFFPHKIKSALFDDFNTFRIHKEKKSDALSVNQFNSYLSNYKSSLEESDPLHSFMNAYFKEIALIYLIKIRILLLATENENISISYSEIQNPNSFFSKLFLKGSSSELKVSCFESSQYTWYRPQAEIAQNIFHEREVVQINLLLSLLKENSYTFAHHSHTLSHKYWGLFINSLMINFPKWDEGFTSPKQSCEQEIVSTLFKGDQTNSLFEAFHQAQHYNSYQEWNELICADFHFTQKTLKSFEIIQELMSIADNLILGKKDTPSSIKHLIETNKKHFQNKIRLADQTDPFINLLGSKQLYNRIFYHDSLIEPSSSHHLSKKIEESSESLLPSGYLYISTNHNILQKSYSALWNKISLKNRLVALYDFSSLKGKGEIPQFIFILKNDHKAQEQYSYNKFKITGNLKSFFSFSTVLDEQQIFFEKTLEKRSLFYSKESKNYVEFNYHQAIIAPNKITVQYVSPGENIFALPDFNKKIVKNSISLDSLFKIKSFYFNSPQDEFKSPYYLGLEILNKKIISMKIHSLNDFFEFRENNSHLNMIYFELFPRANDINIDVLNHFFNSTIGKDLLALTIHCSKTILSMLKLVLVPHACLEVSKQNQFKSLFEKYQHQDNNTLYRLFQETYESNLSPAQRLQFLISFKDFIETRNANINPANHHLWHNEQLLKSISKHQKFTIANKHPEIFWQTLCAQHEFETAKLTELHIKNEQNEIHEIILLDKSTPILSIKGTPRLNSLLAFLLPQAKGKNISKILQAISVPLTIDLDFEYNHFTQSHMVVDDMIKAINSNLNNLFNQVILS